MQPAAFRSRQPTRRAVYAKHSAQGSAKYDCSFNVLDYQTTLTIFLKQTNDTAILATFNNEMKSCSWLTKGVIGWRFGARQRRLRRLLPNVWRCLRVVRVAPPPATNHSFAAVVENRKEGGCAPGSGFARIFRGQRPNRGHSP